MNLRYFFLKYQLMIKYCHFFIAPMIKLAYIFIGPFLSMKFSFFNILLLVRDILWSTNHTVSGLQSVFGLIGKIIAGVKISLKFRIEKVY